MGRVGGACIIGSIFDSLLTKLFLIFATNVKQLEGIQNLSVLYVSNLGIEVLLIVVWRGITFGIVLGSLCLNFQTYRKSQAYRQTRTSPHSRFGSSHHQLQAAYFAFASMALFLVCVICSFFVGGTLAADPASQGSDTTGTSSTQQHTVLPHGLLRSEVRETRSATTMPAPPGLPNGPSDSNARSSSSLGLNEVGDTKMAVDSVKGPWNQPAAPAGTAGSSKLDPEQWPPLPGQASSTAPQVPASVDAGGSPSGSGSGGTGGSGSVNTGDLDAPLKDKLGEVEAVKESVAKATATWAAARKTHDAANIILSNATTADTAANAALVAARDAYSKLSLELDEAKKKRDDAANASTATKAKYDELEAAAKTLPRRLKQRPMRQRRRTITSQLRRRSGEPALSRLNRNPTQRDKRLRLLGKR